MISSGYINYIREIKSKDKILQIQIKILKKDISKLQKELIKNQIDKLEKIYPHTFVREFRLYLKSHEIPFITKFPFNDYKGYVVMCFDPNDKLENYYEDGEEKKHKLTDEILDRRIYDGTSKKKETKPLLRIVE
jgi:5'-deoxynucleotidase YfbR-like HD superfamily hydrolase